MESRIVGSTQCLFYLMLVTDRLQLAGSHHKIVSHTSHVVIIQYIPKDFKVLGFVYSGIFTYLVEVRECTPLSGFMGNIRLFYRINSVTVVRCAFRLRTGPAESARTGFYMILVMGLPLPAVAYGSSCIYVAWVGCFPIINEFAYPWHPASGRLISTRQHAIRGIVSILLGQGNRFVHQILVDRLAVAQSRTVIRPAWTFRLQIKTDKVRSNKCGFRRTERVETHMIQPVVAANAEYPFP